MNSYKVVLPLVFLVFSSAVSAGNTSNYSFNKAKKMLEREVYHDHRVTIYCGAKFDAKKNIESPKGFTTTTHLKRSKKVEWEHVVPAQNFGQAFSEWRDGHKGCVNSKGKSFKGRSCASKVNKEYRYMQADMHNLFPAIGAVNALRSNYNFGFCRKLKIHRYKLRERTSSDTTRLLKNKIVPMVSSFQSCPFAPA